MNDESSPKEPVYAHPIERIIIEYFGDSINNPLATRRIANGYLDEIFPDRKLPNVEEVRNHIVFSEELVSQFEIETQQPFAVVASLIISGHPFLKNWEEPNLRYLVDTAIQAEIDKIERYYNTDGRMKAYFGEGLTDVALDSQSFEKDRRFEEDMSKVSILKELQMKLREKISPVPPQERK